MMNIRLRLLLFSLLLLAVSAVRSQDEVTLLAMRHDADRMQTVLEGRAAIEAAVEVVHSYNKNSVLTYEDVCKELDKYGKCLDWLTVGLEGIKLYANVSYSFSFVSERITSIRTLLDTFRKQCIAKGQLYDSDLLIIRTCQDCLESIAGHVSDLVYSVRDVALYGTGQVFCTTESLMTILSSINDAVDAVRHSVDQCYFVLSRYITSRLFLFSPRWYRARSIRQIAQDAFDNWCYSCERVGR